MSSMIPPHEPSESLLSSVDEAFSDAKASEKRWEKWQQENQLKSVSINLPESDYQKLESLAQKQQKSAPQLIEALVHNVLSTLLR